ncbi:MAG: hypothetical protein QM760_16045 [Nibricoccus sp.]
MKLDVRFPMGLLFLILGVILSVYGFISNPEIYAKHSLGVNLNLQWGTVFGLFGITMLFLSRKRRSGRF